MTHTDIQVGVDVPAWASSLYAAMDAGDIETMVTHFSEDIRVNYANAEPIVGRDTFTAVSAQPPGGIRRMAHTFRQVWESGDSTILIADVEYTRRDDAIVHVPCATVIHRRPDGLIDRMQVFVDMTPVMA